MAKKKTKEEFKRKYPKSYKLILLFKKETGENAIVDGKLTNQFKQWLHQRKISRVKPLKQDISDLIVTKEGKNILFENIKSDMNSVDIKKQWSNSKDPELYNRSMFIVEGIRLRGGLVCPNCEILLTFIEKVRLFVYLLRCPNCKRPACLNMEGRVIEADDIKEFEDNMERISENICTCGYIFESEDTTKKFYEMIKRDNVEPNSVIFAQIVCPECKKDYIILRSIDKDGKLNPIPK